jgi:hypothetical protein
MLGRALSYLVLYSSLGMILRWSWGVRLLSVSDPSQQGQGQGKKPDGSDTDNEEGEEDEEDESPLIRTPAERSSGSGGSSPKLGKRRSGDVSDTDRTLANGSASATQSGWTTPVEPNPFTSNENNRSKTNAMDHLAADSDGSEHEEDEEWGLPRGVGRRAQKEPGAWRRRWNKTCKYANKSYQQFTNFMSMPL